MDYDDNDILHHNPQLAGEGRSRSSSILRPYDFPKFDFDDSLQGHLRFDSLVETEVFLGIQSQEDNQWIEDFSRGSNGMEFNSTPADSCSISRRNNVWSEATSSESVEMLLKSVGQEEMMPGEAIIQDSNTCDDQDTVTEHVELGNMLGQKNDVMIENSEATLPQEELKNRPCSEGRVEGQLRQALEPSQTVAKIESACISSIDLANNAAHGKKGWTSANEGSSSYCDGSSNEDLEELKSSHAEPMKCEAEQDSLCFVKTVNNINSNLVVLSDPTISQLKSVDDPFDSCDNDRQEKHGGGEYSETSEGKRDEASIHMCNVGSSVCLATKTGVVNMHDSGEGSLNYSLQTADKSTGLISEMGSSQEEGRNELFTTAHLNEKHEVEILPSSSKIPFEDCQDASAADCIGQHSADSGIGNASPCASAEQEISTFVQLACTGDSDQMKGVPVIPPTNESTSATPLSAVEDNKVPIDKHDYSVDVNVNKSSDKIVLSPVSENEQTINTEECHTDTGVIVEESAARIPTSVTEDSKPVIKENLDHVQADSAETNQCMHITTEQDGNLSSAAANVNAENNRMLKHDQGAQSLDISNEVIGSGASAAPNDLTEYELREPTATGLSHSDNDSKESSSRIEPNAGFRTGIDSGSKCEASVTDDANRTPLSELSTVSPQPIEKSPEVGGSGSSPITANNSLDSNQSQVDLGHNRSLKESPNSELVSEGNCELTRKAEGGQEPAQTSEVDKASCGSPTIITSSEPCQMETDKQEPARGSEVTGKSVNDVHPSSEDPKADDTAADDTSFTFKVNALPDTTERDSRKCWSPLPMAEKCNSSTTVEVRTPSGQGKTGRTPSQKTPRKSARVSEGGHVPGTSKGISEHKGRKSSAKGTARENAKGNQAKRTNLDSSSGKGGKISNTLLSTPSISNSQVHIGQMQTCGQIQQSDTKLSSAIVVPTSSLPDLNTSALSNSTCPLASFRQPFTDSQQVQLRAQIFVYGSLIQGTAPDEACMVSAFGPSDGGRTIWEPVWRAAVERVRSKKSTPSTADTPLHSQSGPRPSDAAVKQSPHSSKLLPSPVSRSSSKGMPGPVVNPIIPLSSPLWSISTPFRDSLPSTGAHKSPVADYQHVATPIHSYQTPPIRNFVGHASWPSQTCFPGPWVAPPRASTLNSTVCFQPVTMTETVKLTPVKEISGPLASGVKHITSSPPPVQTAGPGPVNVVISSLPDQKAVSSTEKHSADAKPRKRKKVSASDSHQVSLVSEARTEPVVVTNVTDIISSSPAPILASPGPPSDAVPSKADASVIFSDNHSEKSELKAPKVVSCSEEALTKVVEAKSEAEAAAAAAAAAVKNSEDLWSQLTEKRDSGLTSEAEAKLASAAVAIAAAASVTKAAAAAAKLAYNAALQAKLMADEAIISGKSCLTPSGCKGSTDICAATNCLPASLLKGDKITSQSSVILVAAKEAAKRKIEAASAASKQAENLDAIVKAAELATTAVTQAGKIVAMGEPLPLGDLIEVGPKGYWKLAEPPCELAEKPMDKNKGQCGIEGIDTSAKIFRESSVERGGLKASTQKRIHSRQTPSGTLEGHLSVDGVRGVGHNAERDLRNKKGFEASNSAVSCALINEADNAPRMVQNEHEDVGVLHEDTIKEGSLVEVFKHGDRVKSAWYSANVLTLEDGKAFVCYSDLLSEKGSGNLCEWIALECEADKAPIIRAAHPLTALQSQGTRKRRRAALGDYAWRIGDRVDVWINDCWWEGVVTEKNEKDETTLKVHFPAQGDTSTVRAWNLRTSRFWTDGKWVEWSSSGRHNASEQSDTPQEKRQKTGSPTIPAKGKDISVTDVDYASRKPEESKLALSTGDRVFDIGKSTQDDNKRATRKPLRTGQQKEGSRVIFGVPKPTGKKRKFMEVSKHFSANRTDKSSETNDSVKFAKYLMPQTATARGWKAPGRNESKERRTIASVSRAPVSRKPTRTLTQKDNLKSTAAQSADNVTSYGNDIEVSVGDDENNSEKVEFPTCEETAEAPLSSLLTTSKKISSSNAKSERLNKGKLAPVGGMISKIEDRGLGDDSGKPVPEANEPRRSNRRIQPTHRLLEGLQSSMIIPKMSSISHDKGLRSHNRNVSTKGKLL